MLVAREKRKSNVAEDCDNRLALFGIADVDQCCLNGCL